MKPEKDKYYWIEFGYGVYARRCIAVTERGGIFDVPCTGHAETYSNRIVAEAEMPPPKPAPLWKRFFGFEC